MNGRRINLPITLTLFRLTMVPAFLALLVRGEVPACRWTAVGLFAAMAVTDKLDGWLARRWNQVTRIGSLLDPAADKILVTASVALLAIPRFSPTLLVIPPPLVIGIYLKDVGVMIGIAVVVRMTGHVKLAARRPGKWATVSQLALVMTTLLMPEFIAISWYWAGTLIWIAWYVTLAATAAAGFAYSMEGARQLRVHTAITTEPNGAAAGS